MLIFTMLFLLIFSCKLTNVNDYDLFTQSKTGQGVMPRLLTAVKYIKRLQAIVNAYKHLWFILYIATATATTHRTTTADADHQYTGSTTTTHSTTAPVPPTTPPAKRQKIRPQLPV